MRLTKTVGEYYLGAGSINNLSKLLNLENKSNNIVYIIDDFFKDKELLEKLPLQKNDIIQYVNTSYEPTTEQVDKVTALLRQKGNFSVAVGIGGGSTLDITKAVSNLLSNGGKAEDYQGWDLLPKPGIFKIGIPTLSGTGAEASRTCVLMNHAKKLKLGHNSDYTVFDSLILDSELTASVPKEQYFYTGMDTFIHCIESLEGHYRHTYADALSESALKLTREVFSNDDMQSSEKREALMVASFMGGSAIGNSYVGVVHPFSAGLSMVLGIHHCIGNCIVMNVMDEFYPYQTNEFHQMVETHSIQLPNGICKNLTDEQFQHLYEATIIHEKPLVNALGENFKNILTPEKVRSIFERM